MNKNENAKFLILAGKKYRVIHYKHHNKYDIQLTQITERKQVLQYCEQRANMKKNDDSHFKQHCMIPNNRYQKNYKYYLNLCYKIFTGKFASKTAETKIISKRENRGFSVKS